LVWTAAKVSSCIVAPVVAAGRITIIPNVHRTDIGRIHWVSVADEIVVENGVT
jgi:hypothetical protein